MDLTAAPLRLVGYTRISDDDEKQGRGVARQEADIRRWAERHGHTVVDVIVENDVGASFFTNKPRPKYATLLRAIETRAWGIDGAVCYSVERMTRRLGEGEHLMRLGAAGHHIFGIVEGYDLCDEYGRERYLDDIKDAAKEAAKISRRVRSDQAQARDTGRRHNGSRRLFGYAMLRSERLNGGGRRQFVDPPGCQPGQIVEREAEAARHMVGMVAEGHSANSVARWANEAGYRTTEGNRWASSTVASYVRNPVISGQVSHYGEVVGSGGWEPLVDVQDWRAAVVALERWRQPGRRSGGRPTPFSGLFICAHCERPMMRSQSSTGQRLYTVWRCRPDHGGCGQIVTAAAEDYVAEALFTGLPDFRARRRASADRPVLRSLAEVQADWDKLFRARGRMSEDAYREHEHSLTAEEGAIHAASLTPTEAERLLDSDDDLRDVWEDGLSTDTKRGILHIAFTAIRVSRGDRRRWSDDVADERLDICWST